MFAKLSVDKALMKAKLHSKRGEVDEAKKLYEAILNVFSKNKRAQKELDALNNKNQVNEILSPPKGIIDQLISHYNCGNYLFVVEKAEALTKQYPKSFLIWNILGVTSSVLGKKDIAVNSYKKCISANPNYPDAYSNMGLALHDQSKFDEVKRKFTN